MAQLTVRKQNDKPRHTIAPRHEAGPFTWTRQLFGWDPFARMIAPFERVFEEVPEFFPAFEVKESNGSYLFKGDVPGVAEKDIEITRTGNRLLISGKRDSEKEEKGDTFYTCERSYGSFSRSFTLPDGVDIENIAAELKDGVLTVTVPKLPAAQPKKIAVGKPEDKH
jgi:HSP20 family protein